MKNDPLFKEEKNFLSNKLIDDSLVLKQLAMTSASLTNFNKLSRRLKKVTFIPNDLQIFSSCFPIFPAPKIVIFLLYKLVAVFKISSFGKSVVLVSWAKRLKYMSNMPIIHSETAS